MNTWLIIDCNYICYRSFYAFKGITHDDVPMAVAFGFFDSVRVLKEQWRTDKVIFCFDYGLGLRKKMFKGYKGKRHKDLTEDEELALNAFRSEVDALRDDYLPKLGYANVFYQSGYEGDDIMASVARSLPEGDEGILVTADEDLLQCISPTVKFYSPSKPVVTYQSFYHKWGFKSSDWWKVKALGGCSTDEVPGIPGIGEKTAAKYLLGQLKPTSKAYQSIRSKEGKKIRRRNIPLVKLPLKGTNRFELRSDSLDSLEWEDLSKGLGFANMRPARKLKKKKDGFNL